MIRISITHFFKNYLLQMISIKTILVDQHCWQTFYKNLLVPSPKYFFVFTCVLPKDLGLTSMKLKVLSKCLLGFPILRDHSSNNSHIHIHNIRNYKTSVNFTFDILLSRIISFEHHSSNKITTEICNQLTTLLRL